MLHRFSFTLAALLVVAVLFLLPDIAAASTFYVSTTGANTNAGTEADPWRDIQYAISTSATVNGDIIIVEEGVYNELISFGTKSVTVASRHMLDSDTSHIALTVIDGGYSGTVVTITSDVTLHGLTIRHGGNVSNGGGIHISNAGPVLSQLAVHDNWSTSHGGGIYLTGSDALISNSTVTDNTSGANGGGLYMGGSPVQLSNTTVVGNSANGNGGGLYVNNSDAAISNMTVTANSAGGNGGGLYINNSEPALAGLTAEGNTALLSGGGVVADQSDVVFTGGSISNNEAQFDAGGGMIVRTGSSVALTNFTISDNTANTVGGGVYVLDSELLLDSSSVTDNIAWNSTSNFEVGGGLYLENSTLYSSTATISSNTAKYGGGGGIAIIGEASVPMPASGLPPEYAGRTPGLHDATISNNGADYNGGGVLLSEANIAISNSTISGNTTDFQGGGIYCEVGALALSNCTMSSNTAIDQGGAIYIMGNPCLPMATGLLLKNSTLTSNYAGPCLSSGGGIYAENTELYVDSTIINGNYGVSGGGGVVVIQPEAESIPCMPVAAGLPVFPGEIRGFRNTDISNNGTEGNGGGIYMIGVTEEILSNCTINNNTSGENGGGIYCTEGILVLTNSTVDENSTMSNGGGIYIVSSPCSPVTTALLLDSSSVSNNESWEVEGGGGGIYSELAELYVSTATINGNYADSWGGGVLLVGNMVFFCQPVASALPPAFDGRVRGFVDTHIDYNGADGSGGGVFMIGITEELLSNSTVSNNTSGHNGGGMRIDGSRIVLDQVAVGNNYCAHDGGGIYAEGSDIHATSATISNNGSFFSGGGVWWSEGYGASRMPESAAIPSACDLPIGLSNSTVEDNTSGDSGGGMYISYIEEFNLSNSLVSVNSAASDGGGIYARNTNVYLDNVSVLTNEAGSNGGGVYLYQSGLYVTNATVEANSALSNGGGLYTAEAYDAGVSMPAAGLPPATGIYSSSFSSNIAFNGGGIYAINNPEFLLSNVTLSQNSAASNGGGIYVEEMSDLSLSNVVLSNNTANGNGGGIHGYLVAGLWSNLSIAGNSAYGSGGGGVYLDSTFQLTMDNAHISGNIAASSDPGCTGGGGVMAVACSSLIFRNATITGNYAQNTGGGLSLYNGLSSTDISLLNSIVWNNEAGDGANVHRCGSEIVRAYFSVIPSADASVGANLIECDPQFVAAVDPMDAPTASGDLRLQNISPAIGTGVEAFEIESVLHFAPTYDIEGTVRTYIPDIGAYENALDAQSSSIAAFDDAAISCNGGQVAVDVLANDSNTVDGAVSILDYTQGTSGSVSTDGSMLVYTPNGDFEGVDTFTYRVTTASCGVASTATVSVIVSRIGVYAVDMDGSDDYGQAPAGTWFGGDFTIEAFVRVESYNHWSRLIDFGNGPDSNNVYVALSDGTSGHVVLGVHEGGNNNRSIVVTPDPIPLNQWVHLALVLDGNEGRIYKNGELWASGAMTVTPLGNETSLNYIGKSHWNGDGYADAKMSELRIWSTARTQSEIQDNMLGAPAGNETGLELYYPFNDGQGTTAHDGSGGNDADLYNSPGWINGGAIAISGSATVSATTSVYSVFPAEEDGAYSWSVSGGTIISGATTSSIEVLWDDAAHGTVVVTAANAYCSAGGSLDIRIFYPGPIYYVCTTTGSNENGTGSPGNPFETIAYGIEIAGDGQVVLVCPGTYYENIEIYENVTVASWHYTTGDSVYISQTIIDGGEGSGDPVAYIEDVTSATLTGFTVQNGNADFGGGVQVVYASPVLSHLVVRNNEAYLGGGISVWYEPENGSRAILSNVTVHDNTAGVNGGGIYCEGMPPQLSDVVVFNNAATGDIEFGGGFGGGIFVSGLESEEPMPTSSESPVAVGDTLMLSNVTVHSNSSSSIGGGMYIEYSTVVAENLHVYNNNSWLAGGGIAVVNGSAAFDSLVVTTNTLSGGIESYLSQIGGGGGLWVSGIDVRGMSPGMPATAPVPQSDSVVVSLANAVINGNFGGFQGGGVMAIGDLFLDRGDQPSAEIPIFIMPVDVYISNSTIAENTAWGGAGGYLSIGAGTHLDSVTIRGNMAGAAGGLAIFAYNVLISNCVIDSNTAEEGPGGGVYITDYSSQLPAVDQMIEEGIVFSGTTVRHNTATDVGGGFYIVGNDIALSNTVVSENSSGGDGGGIYLNNGSMTLAAVSVGGNVSGGRGGGIYAFDANIQADNSSLRGNTGTQGGGLSLVSGADLIAYNVLVSGNYSTIPETSCSGGGGVMLAGSGTTAHFVNATITGNMAESQGGGVLVNYDSELLLMNSIVLENEAASYADIRRCSTGYISAAHSILESDSPLDEAINVIDCAPFFVSPADAEDAPTSAGNYALQDISPAIGNGATEVVLTNSTMAETTLTAPTHDIEETVRGNAVPDIGAYENSRELQLSTIAAVDDTADACINTAIPIAALGNDGNDSEFSLEISAFTQGTSGTVTIEEGDVLVYTPNTSFTGTDSFTYTIEAGGTCSIPTTATVYIDVREAFAAVVTGATSLFAGEQAVYTVTNASLYTAFQWSADGGVVIGDPSGTAPAIKWNTSGTVVTTGVVYLALTDIRGCITTATLDVQVIPFIPVVIEGDEETVGDTTGVYSTGGIDTTGASFAWTISEGGAIVSSTTGASVVVEWEDVNEPTTGTITVEIITAGGGVGSTTFVVTIYPRPIIHISGNVDPCSGAAEVYSAVDVRNTGSILEWSVNGGTIIGETTGATIVVQWAMTTTTTMASIMVIGQEPHDFDGVTTSVVTIHPNPMLSITGGTSACSGAVHTYSVVDAHGTNSGYNWSVVGGTIIGDAMLSNVTVSWNTTNGPINGTLTVTAVSPEGCTGTTAGVVQINPNPMLSISGDMSACSGAVHSYSVSDANTTNADYMWSVSGGAIVGDAMLSNVTVLWNTTDSQSGGVLTVVATTPEGCSSTIATSVQINPNPALSIAGSTGACSGAVHSYSVSDANNTGAEYMWTVDGGAIVGSSLLSNVTVLWNTTDSQSGGVLTVVATTPEGCSSTIATSVQINPNPMLSISGDMSACSGAVHSYSVSDANNTGAGYLWTVDGGAIVGSALLSNVTVQWNTTDSQTGGVLTVVATTPEGCSSTIATSVQINPNPALSVIGSTSACSEAVESYSAGDANNTGAEYMWTVDGGAIIGSAVLSNVTVQWNTVNTQTNGVLTLVATTPEGCSSTIATSVQLNPRPVLTIAGAASVCADSVQKYTVSDANNTQAEYMWSVSGGAIISGQGTASPTIRWGTAGAATLSVAAVTPMGCSEATNIPVTVNPNPVPVVSGALSFCAGGSTVLDAGAGYSAYLWSNGATTQTVAIAAAGVYAVTVFNASGCSATTSASVVELPPVVAHAGTDITICTGASVQLDGRGTSFIGDIVFRWWPETGLSNPHIADPVASPTATTTYTLTVTDGYGCSSVDQLTITVMPAMVVSASGDGLICRGGSTQLQATGGVSYSWSPATGLDNAFIANPTASPATTTLYSVAITNENGCTTTASVTVTVSAPVADAGQDVSICAGGTAQLQATGGVSYVWSPADGLNDPNIAAPLASPSATTTYTVTVTNGLGCSSTATVTVTVEAVVLQVAVLLEGAYDSGQLNTNLQSQGLVPAAQPYNTAPYHYSGGEQLATSSADVVDWVLLELRTAANPESVAARRAALLLNDGRIVDTDGTSSLSFPVLAASDGYYVVVYCRNHLPVMSAVYAVADGNCGMAYTFSATPTAAYESFMAAQTMLDSTHFALWTGDVDQDGIVNSTDRVLVRNATGRLGYEAADLSLDGIVNSLDRILVRNNAFRVSQVP